MVVLWAALLTVAVHSATFSGSSSSISSETTDATGSNPIRRIVTLLQKMQTEVQDANKHDQELNEKFVCYCSTNDGELSSETAELRARIPMLEADIERTQGEKARLDQELVAHQQTRVDAKSAIDKSTAQREKEAEEFAAESAELKGNVASCNAAQEALHKGLTSMFLQGNNGAALRKVMLTRQAANLNRYSRETLTAFLAQGSRAEVLYTPASGEVIGIIHQLQQDFKAALKDVTDTENSALSEFQGLVAAKEKEIQAATEAIEQKTARAGEVAVQIVSLKADLTDTENSLGEDEKFLMDLKENCDTKAGEYDERKAARNEELVAISETIKVLNGDDSLDLFKKTLDSPSLIQIANHDRELRKAALKEIAKAKKTGVREIDLNFITLALKGKKEGFDKIIKLIDDLFVTLGKEQEDDDKHRDWCNVEFSNADVQKVDLQHRIEGLGTRETESGEAIKAVVADIDELHAGLTALDRSVEDATGQRKTEHKQFLSEQQENNAALELLGVAKNRLSKFYNPSQYVAPTEEDDAATFFQVAEKKSARSARRMALRDEDDDEPSPPPKTASAYEKRDAGGPLALLDKLAHDLELDMQNSERDEKEGQKAYESFMSDGVLKRKADSEAITEKESQKAELEADNMAAKDLRERKSNERTAVLEYEQQLHGSCDFLLSNYDTRKTARANEVEALKNAKSVLHGASYALVQDKANSVGFLKKSK